MFSLRSDSQPRRARVYGVNKRATSSRPSLLSSITSQSKKSTSSSSTVTQESYSKSETQSKRRSSRITRHRSTRTTLASMQAGRRPRRSSENSASDADVFSYLVEDIVDPSGTSTSWEAERSRISKRATVQGDPDELETRSVQSRFSDSGVSMNDSGYDSTSPTTYTKPRLGSLPENVFVENYRQLQRHQFDAPAQIPQPYTQGHATIPYPYHYEYGPRPPNPQHCSTSDDPRRHAITTNQTPLSGYSLLASHLSPGPSRPPHLAPIYRRFTTLNHRLLLQLQDEISELETELRRLDDNDTYHRQLQDLPASRRTEWASGRLELLSKIHMKLEHYHGAVLRMVRVKAATSNASGEDVEAYRAYLAAQRPLQELEMRFLDDGEDLMSLDVGFTPIHASLPAPSPPNHSSHLHPPYNFTLLSTLAGIWLLACVPSLFSRWIFLLLLACLTIGTQPSSSTLRSPSSSSRLSLWTRLAEAYKRAKEIAPPLLFWMAVMMIC
jgi:hypothetical protein